MRTVLLSGILIASIAGPVAAQVQPRADGERRVAYLSTLAEKAAAERIGAIEKQVERHWPPDARDPRARIAYRTFRYELPLPARPAGTEGADEAARRNEQIRQRNERQVADMLAWQPDVIYAPGALPALAAGRATTTIPIVFGCKCNPLKDGWDLVRDPARPERNLTGFTRYHLDMVEGEPWRRLNLNRKRIELLQTAGNGAVSRIGAIYGDDYDEAKWQYEAAARALGVEWVRVKLTEETIDHLPELLKEHRVDAGLVLADTFLDKFAGRLARSSAKSGVPVMFPWDEADAGAWMHYGTVVDIPAKAAEYVVNILKGRKVADYAVEFPKQMELAVNFRTAKAHGREFPREFLLQVDRAIE